MCIGDLVVRIWLGQKMWNMLGLIIGSETDEDTGLTHYNVAWYTDGKLNTRSMSWRLDEMEVINEIR